MAALLGDVFTLQELALPEVAAQQRVALRIDSIAEVLARHTDLAAVIAHQLPLVDEVPLLHNPPNQYVCTSKGKVNTAALSPKKNLLPYTSTGSC